MPVCSLEEVDEIDAERVFSLTHLPILTVTAALQLLAEQAHLVRQRLFRRRAAFSFTSWALRTNSPNCCNDT